MARSILRISSILIVIIIVLSTLPTGSAESLKATYPNPLLCSHDGPKQAWDLAPGNLCGKDNDHHENSAEAVPKNKEARKLYRHNIVQYKTEGWVCRKVTHQIETFTYFFNDENLKKSRNFERIVDKSECEQMQQYNRCSAGLLSRITPSGSSRSTSNKMNWYYPGGGMHCCHWKRFEVTNCFLTKVFCVQAVWKRSNGINSRGSITLQV